MNVSKVLEELSKVDSLTNNTTPIVSIFGSARLNADSPYYALSQQIASVFSSHGYTVATGGGPGLMRAAQEGVQHNKAKSIGINIALPFEPPVYDLQDESYVFEYFFTRKLAFANASSAFVAMPGGMGTLDELFDVLTLMQTGKIKRCPVILMGTEFWQGLIDWMKNPLISMGLVFQEEIDQLGIFDDPMAAFEFVESQTVMLQDAGSLWQP